VLVAFTTIVVPSVAEPEGVAVRLTAVHGYEVARKVFSAAPTGGAKMATASATVTKVAGMRPRDLSLWITTRTPLPRLAGT
jgi:hypothetical protein